MIHRSHRDHREESRRQPSVVLDQRWVCPVPRSLVPKSGREVIVRIPDGTDDARRQRAAH